MDDSEEEQVTQSRPGEYQPTDSMLSPGLNKSVPEIRADKVRTGSPAYTGKGVIVGIIDSGIDIFHNCFRRPDNERQSRVLAIWDQTLTSAEAPGRGPPIARGFANGIEFTAVDIDNALIHDPDGQLERGEPGYFPHRDSEGHGTAIAGIAAGNGAQAGQCHGANTYIGVAPEADLVVVKIPLSERGVVRGVVNPDKAVLDAIKYVFNFAGNRPVVVNLSISVLHVDNLPDGKCKLETDIDALLQVAPNKFVPGRAIVCIAGNYGDRQSRMYAKLPANGALTRSIVPQRLKLPHETFRPVTLEILYTGDARLQITVETPSGPLPSIDAGNHLPNTPTAGGDTVAITSSIGGVKPHTFSVTIFPPNPQIYISPGRWAVTFREKAGKAVELYAMNWDMGLWIGFDGADPDDWKPHTPKELADFEMERLKSVTMPGSALNVITVGSYSAVTGELEPQSGRSAVHDVEKPEICAPGVGVYSPASASSPAGARTNWYCCDFWRDFYVDTKGGTSVAAPHVTGVVALMLQKNKALDSVQIRKLLSSNVKVGSPTGVGWGRGKVDALRAIAAVPAAGGGGGGGGGNNITSDPVLPFASEDGYYLPGPRRLRDAFSRFRSEPAAQLLAALASTHFDEIYRLIRTRRRVAALWNRLGGPLLVRAILSSADDPSCLTVHDADAQARSRSLRRLLRLLGRDGSVALRADIARHAKPIVELFALAVRPLNS